MENVSPGAARVAFGPFCLSAAERLLTRDGVPVDIGGRSLDLLAALVEQPGRVLSKRDLLRRVWPDVVVEDGSLRFHMAGLRKLLGDGEAGARYIATQVGVGYAFVAPVQYLAPVADPPVATAIADGLEERYRVSDWGAVGGLPARLARLIGRDRDVALLAERLALSRLFTIVGPAGVGKTSLAVELGHRLLAGFDGRVVFVDLGTVEDADLVGSALAGSLGIAVQAEDPMLVILAHLRARRLMLILDNCEHLIGAVSAIVERIYDAAAEVAILATSREPLRARGEHVHWLAPLDCPSDAAGLSPEQLLAFPAVDLFVERARAGNSLLGVEPDDVRLIADMCRRLDGMALPIELAAVRVASHGVEATSLMLGERFSLGWAGRRTAQPRQQTLQATLDWSYDLLSPPERLMLDRLSIFVGPFSIDAAIGVVTDASIDDASALAALDGLTAKSLVAPDRAAQGGSYRLLEMTRAYAKHRLAGRGAAEQDATARRHALFFLAALGDLGVPSATFDRPTRFSPQIGNIRAALEWSFGAGGDPAIAVPLAAAGAPVLLNLSLLAECRDWCARAIETMEEGARGSAVEHELQAALGLSLMFTRGNSQAAEVALRRALAIAEALDDRPNQLRLLGRLHIFHERIGDFDTARGWADQAVAVAATIGEPEAIGIAASLAGISHHLAGDQRLARQELELSLRLSLPSDRCRTLRYGFDHRNRSTIALARTLWLQGHADQARAMAERAVAEAAGLEHPVTHCIALIWALSVHIWRGDLDAAEAGLDVFARSAELNAFGPYIAASGGFRGQLAIQQGQVRQAVGWIEESLARLHAARYELLTTSFAIALIHGLTLSGRHGEALDLADATIDLCAGHGEMFAMPELLRLKARVVQGLDGRSAAEAETLLLDALDWSRRQGACAWELRAASDLAGLWIDQARVPEALALLQPLLEGFTEGTDTADLRAAHVLLRLLRDLDPGADGRRPAPNAGEPGSPEFGVSPCGA